MRTKGPKHSYDVTRRKAIVGFVHRNPHLSMDVIADTFGVTKRTLNRYCAEFGGSGRVSGGGLASPDFRLAAGAVTHGEHHTGGLSQEVTP